MKEKLIILFIVLAYITIMFEVRVETIHGKESLHASLVHSFMQRI